MKISKKNGGKRFYRFRITFFRHCPSISTSADNDSYELKSPQRLKSRVTKLTQVKYADEAEIFKVTGCRQSW